MKNEQLTPDQAYEAVRTYLRTYYAAAGMPEDIALLHANMELDANGSSKDPEMKNRWDDAISAHATSHQGITSLTTMEAYKLTQAYLDHYYFNVLGEPDGLGLMLGCMALLPDGTSMEAVALNDWHRVVKEIVGGDSS